MPSIEELIATDLGVMPEWVSSAVANAPNNCKLIRIPKQTGGTRAIYQPAIESKMIQRWLMSRLLRFLPVSEISTAFAAGSSIVKNAHAHKHSRYSVRVDVANFFPSLTVSDLWRVIVANKTHLPGWATESRAFEILSAVCFQPGRHLPIGYPSSPCIANAVMYDLDRKLLNLIKADPSKFGRAVLTRYADDFVFSTDLSGACSEFVSAVRRLFSECDSPKLALKLKKTRMMSRASGSTLITGLRVKPNGEVGIHANYRDSIRLLLRLFAQGRLDATEAPSLRGHLAFIEYADPGLFTRLSFRYHRQIEHLLRGRPIELPRGFFAAP